MFYPLLAGGAGCFSAEAVVWALLHRQRHCDGRRHLGGRASRDADGWFAVVGLAFALNLGFISEMNIDGAGVVAAAAAFGAVLMLLDEKLGWAVALLTISVLSREAMLIAVAGSAFWLWRRGR